MQRSLIHIYVALKGDELVFDSNRGFIKREEVKRTTFETNTGDEDATSTLSGLHIRDSLKKGIWAFLGAAFGGQNSTPTGGEGDEEQKSSLTEEPRPRPSAEAPQKVPSLKDIISLYKPPAQNSSESAPSYQVRPSLDAPQNNLFNNSIANSEHNFNVLGERKSEPIQLKVVPEESTPGKGD